MWANELITHRIIEIFAVNFSACTPPTTHGNRGAIITPRKLKPTRSNQSIPTLGPHCHVPSDAECAENVSADVTCGCVASKPTG